MKIWLTAILAVVAIGLSQTRHAYAAWDQIDCSEIDIKVKVNVSWNGTASCQRQIAQDGGAHWEYQNYFYSSPNNILLDIYYAKASSRGVFNSQSLEELAKSSGLEKDHDIMLGERGSTDSYSYLYFTATAANRSPVQCITFSRQSMRDPQDGNFKRLSYGWFCANQLKPLERAVVESTLNGIDTPN